MPVGLFLKVYIMRFDEYNVPPPKSWKLFQKMVCELFREIWQDPHAQEFGRDGQKQHGIDIIGRRKGRDYEAVQTTIESPLTENKIQKDYEASLKLGVDLNCLIIASTSSRNARLQAFAANLSSTGPHRCIVWFWEDLLEKLAEYEQVRKKYYSNFFFIKSMGDSVGKLVEVNDDTSRYVLLITRLPAEHPHYGGVLLISDLLNYTCQTYRLGDHWTRLVLDDYLKPAHQKCIGGNKYGAFLLSHWLNTFHTIEKVFEIDSNSPSIFMLTEKQKKELWKILDELKKDN